MEVEPQPLLPNLNLLDPRGLKRQASRNAEQNKEKRQFLGHAYDDIIDEAIRKFFPIIFVCDNGIVGTFMFEYSFNGKNRHGGPGRITLQFRAQLRPLTHPRAKREFILSVRVLDEQGMINNWQTMYQSGVPATATIECGQNAPAIKERIRELMTGWLDYAYFNFYV